MELFRLELDGVDDGLVERAPVGAERTIADLRRDEAADGEHEHDRDQLAPEAN